MTTDNSTSKKGFNPITFGRWLTLIGYFSLMAGFYIWHLLITPLEKHLISIIFLLQLGPLMFPLFGLLKGKLYTHAWSMYIAIYYFIVGIWYIGGGGNELYFGLYVTFTSLMFFTGTTVFTRYTGKAQSQSDQNIQ